MIVTAKINEIKKHPNANKLKVCKVTDGKETWSIVCGAQNAREGMVSILAKVGSTTPRGLQIKESNLRGEQSLGMLCSAHDLGIREESGIVDLPPDTALGKDFSSLDPSLLSSTPWFQYKLIDRHFEYEGRIKITPANDKSKGQLISETYWDGENYRYRDYR